MAVVVATGITADGAREVLGLDVGDSEDEVFWRGFLTALKQRGLGGVRLVISDQHAGLVAALQRVLPGRRASTLPGALRPQPARPRAQVAHRHGRRGVPHHLRPTRPDRRRRDLGRGPRPARRPVPQDRPADGRRQGRGARVHRVPASALAQDLVAPTRSSGSTRRSSAAPASWASSPTRPPSSASSAPSWPTCTTNGKPANAATSPKAPWPSSTPTAILNPSPRSTAASRHRGSTSKPTTPRDAAGMRAFHARTDCPRIRRPTSCDGSTALTARHGAPAAQMSTETTLSGSVAPGRVDDVVAHEVHRRRSHAPRVAPDNDDCEQDCKQQGQLQCSLDTPTPPTDAAAGSQTRRNLIRMTLQRRHLGVHLASTVRCSRHRQHVPPGGPATRPTPEQPAPSAAGLGRGGGSGTGSPASGSAPPATRCQTGCSATASRSSPAAAG